MNNLIDFQKEFAGELLKLFDKPAWEPELNEQNKWIINTVASKMGRKPFPGQMEYVIAPQFANLQQNRYGIIPAKMGTGKTTMSNTIAYLLFKKDHEKRGMKVCFLTAGSKHLNKMRREAEAIFGDLADIYTVKTSPSRSKGEITAEEAARMPRVPGRISYFILSKDTGKTTYKFKAMKEGQKCPSCGNRLNNKKVIGKKEVFRCSACNEKTHWAVGGKPSIGQMYKKIAGPKNRKLFDFLIVDEVHEMQNPNSLQSMLYQSLIRVSYRTLIMTGTLANGYASSIFHILYPLFAKHFKRHGFDKEKIGSFVDFFGSKKETSSTKVDISGVQRTTIKVEELPKINERIVSFMAPFSTWFSIEDLNVEMPEFHEFIHFCEINGEIKERFNTWKSEINAIKGSYTYFKDSVGSASLIFNSAMHYRINNPTFPYVETIKGIGSNIALEDREDFEVEVEVPFNPLPSDFISNKEKKLLDILKQEVSEGRRVMVYGVYNQSTGLYARLQEIVSNEGLSVGVLPDKVKSEDIEDWILKFEGDILVLPQKRVATGLDLVMFHTVVFYEIDRQLRVVQQAKVRPWRPIGQDKAVRVHYIAYRGQQERDLELIAKKMRAAATVEGEIIDTESIAGIYDYNPELTAAIASITAQIEDGEIQTESIRLRGLSEFEEFYKAQIKEQEKLELQEPKEAEIVQTIEVKEVIKIIEVEAVEIVLDREEEEQEEISSIPLEVLFDTRGQGYFVF